ncbi:MAG: sigma-54-dependent Fis family transcriptional regulator [Acidobacteria bacterium]|nr:MAG: sigma-54-dependent Fis family transcriptional regulator [Acidobacteriota bacterium]
MGLRQLVGQSKAFVAEIGKLPLIARCDVRVLIQGETGTGKELCARAIHYLSPRSSGPFIPVNCGAIPAELVENELFGHERGAYTGATTAHAGMIHEAEGGTLFLDEIDCLPPVAQVKLLRFIQEKEYRPLGSTKVRHADVRVISATNADTEQAVKEGKLRRDFYYRLNVVPLLLPPLRERRCDIELLAQHFLSKFVSEFNSSVSSIAHAALRKLASYDWPGNVRELEHVMERAVTLAEQSVLQAEDIVLPTESAPLVNDSFSQAKARMIDRFEREYIREMLIAYCGNITKAALAAKKNRRAFWQLIRKHHINVHEFKSDTF